MKIPHSQVCKYTRHHETKIHTKNKTTPKGGFIFGGECEIRTHGGSPHHQFSRLAP